MHGIKRAKLFVCITGYFILLALQPTQLQADVESVHQYGYWELLEGSAEAGGFVCAIEMRGFVKGYSRSIAFVFYRPLEEFRIQLWQGNIIVGPKVRTQFHILTSAGKDFSIGGSVTYSRALSDVVTGSDLLAAIISSPEFTITAAEFLPLTVKTDGLADGLGAVQRCISGETEEPPAINAPMR